MSIKSLGQKRPSRPDSPSIASFFTSRPSEVHENSPSKRLKTTDEQPSPSKQRASGLNSTWLVNYRWLKEQDGGMVCTVCIKHQRRPKKSVPGNTTWVDKPCCNIILHSVKRHNLSDAHKEAEAFERELSMRSTQLVDGFIREETVNRMAMEAAMRCLYWLCKEELPHTTKLPSLLDLCKELGVDVLNALRKGGNASYTSERFVQEAIQNFGDVVMDPILQQARDSPYFAIMCDETTDVAIKKELIIYIRFLDNKGQSSTHFSEMVELPDGKAQTIASALTDHLQQKALPLNKLCALGSDGAAVMLGCRNGVAALLKEQVPHLLSNHCVAHRLALASSQAANGITYIKKFKAIIEQLYRFYHYSPVRTSALQAIQSVLNDPRIKITQAKDVRWLSHDAAIQSVRKCLESVIVSLEREAEERSDVQAMGLSVFIQQYKFVATLHMLSDVLPILSQLSKAMQRRDLDYTFVKPLVAGTIRAVESLKDNPGQHFQELENTVISLAAKPLKFSVPTQQVKDSFKRDIYNKYIDSVMDNLDKRFPDMPLLEAFSVFDLSKVPEDADEAAHHGREDIELLTEHFGLDTASGFEEWRTVANMAPDLAEEPTNKVMSKISLQPEAFPILSKIAAAGLLIPTSTADCERGFSTLKRIKTEHRNRLCNKIINPLLIISMEGASTTEFDFRRCVDRWASHKTRRISFT